MFERRFLHIIEVGRELDFSDCKDIHVSWHCVGKDINVSVLIHQLPNDYSISAKMLNMSDEDLDKDLPILDSEVCSVEVVIYDGWGDDGTGERFIGFTSHLKIDVK